MVNAEMIKKTSSMINVRNRSVLCASPSMKGKNKSRHHHRDIFSFRDIESDDDIFTPSSTFEDLSSFTPSAGAQFMIKETLKPRNGNQELYVKTLESSVVPIIIGTGPAGCGKSLWACITGVRMLQKGAISKLILTRPAVSVDEEHGFLPGTLEDKMDPWIRPLYDVLYRYYTPKQVQAMIEKQIIEICPLAYMRGRTFENSWIILDEAQNTLKNQMLMMLTRIGRGSKLVVTGDPAQHDRGFEVNGLSDLLHRIAKRPQSEIVVVAFSEDDIERHPVIQKVLNLYKD